MTIKNENTKKRAEYWKNVFKKWVNERNFQANLEEYESDVLNQTLSQLYAVRSSVILASMLLMVPPCATQAISATSENTSDINP